MLRDSKEQQISVMPECLKLNPPKMSEQKADPQNCWANYCDFTEIVRDYYREQSRQFPISLSDECSQLQSWIESQEQTHKPFVICSEELSGKKSMMCECIERLSKNNRLIVLAEFGSVNPVYSDILSSITTKIKQSLDVTQKVELNEEKLRRYFKYWLDLASRIVEKDSIGYNYQDKKKIVVFIEGLDLVVDSRGQAVSPAFWLPQDLPEYVRMVFSVKKNSQAHQFLADSGSKVVEISISKENKKRIAPKISEVLREKLSIIELKLLHNLLETSPSLKLKSEHQTMRQILEEYISFAACNGLTKSSIKHVLSCLALSAKGLTHSEIRRVSKLDSEKLALFFSKFVGLIHEFKDVKNIWHPYTKELVTSVCISREQEARNCHLLMAKALKREQASPRVLQERIVQLSALSNLIELKETVCKVENFLWLYTPRTKHLLFSCWMRLEANQQYDPVFEYNKAIESFLNHYYLKEEEVFKIIFQLSLFFKEYADFENSKTPQFRHPYIRGDNSQLGEICLFDELTKMKMLRKERQVVKRKGSVPRASHKRKASNPQRKTRRSNSKKKTQEQKDTQDSFEVSCQLNTQYSENNNSSNQDGENNRNSFNREAEALNVNIISNQDKFRESYLSVMQEYLNQYYTAKSKKTKTDQESRSFSQDDESDEEDELGGLEGKLESQLQKIKQSLVLKSFNQYREDNYHRTGEEQSYYYYKQWLWLQFPWIAQSIQHDFSGMIHACITSPTEYMSIAFEQNLVRQATSIARSAQDSKLQIYKKNANGIGKPGVVDNTYDNSAPSTKRTNILNSQNRSEGALSHSGSLNLSKWKLNISSVRDEIKQHAVSTGRQLRKSQDKGSPSSIFMTQDNNLGISNLKDNSESRLTLPKVTNHYNYDLSGCKKIKRKRKQLTNQNSYAISSKNSKVDEEIQSDFNIVIRKYNSIKHQNDVLIGKIESMKNSVIMLENGRGKNQVQKLLEQIKKMESQRDKVKRSFDGQCALKGKLEIVVKLCNINTTHGSESEELSKFLNSLKWMIGVEQKTTEITRQKINTLFDEYRTEMKRIKDSRKSMEKEMAFQRKKQRIQTLKTMKVIKEQEQIEKKMDRIVQKKANTIRSPLKKATINASLSRTTLRTAKTNAGANQEKTIFRAVEELEKVFERIDITFGLHSENKAKIDQFSFRLEKSVELIDSIQSLTETIEKNAGQVQKLGQQLIAKKKQTEKDSTGDLKQTLNDKKTTLDSIGIRLKGLSECCSLSVDSHS